MGEIKLKPYYSLRELGRVCNLDRRKLQRVLKEADVEPRNGKVWIADLKNHLPHVLDSILEVIYRENMADLRRKKGSGRREETEDAY